MKKKVSIFKKVGLFRFYSKRLKTLSYELENSFNAKVDGASRIYTVINIPSELIEEPYNLKKADIDNLAKNYIRDYSQRLSSYLNSKELIELYDFYDVKKVEKYSYLVIFGFSLFNSVKFLRNVYLSLITLFSLLTILLLYFII